MIELSGNPVDLFIERDRSLNTHYTLSPYVVRDGTDYRLLLRLVNCSDHPEEKVSRIHFGVSRDGQTFLIDAKPVLAPNGQMEDNGGCEDPTIVAYGNRFVVFYSGYSSTTRASYMLASTGNNLRDLAKNGLAFSDARYANPKEAAIVATPAGYRMFFE